MPMIDGQALAVAYKLAAEALAVEAEMYVEEANAFLDGECYARINASWHDKSHKDLAMLLLPYLDVEVKVFLSPDGVSELMAMIDSFLDEEDA